MKRTERLDREMDYLVIIPTVGKDDVLLPSLQRMIQQCDGTRTRIVVSMNPVDTDDAPEVLEAVEALASMAPDGVVVEHVYHDGPLGFGGAVNQGIKFASDNYGFPRTTVVINDDVLVTSGWLPGMRAAIDSPTVRLWGDPQQNDYDMRAYGNVGMAGPASDNVAGIQGVKLSAEHKKMSIDDFAYRYRQSNAGNVIAADFLSGFCFAITRGALIDVAYRDGDQNITGLFDTNAFPIGGYEDNDLCARVSTAGYRSVVAGDIFVHHRGHQTLDEYFPGQMRGMKNRLSYYNKWVPVTKKEQKIIATYRVKIEVANDLNYLRMSLLKAGKIVDGVALLLTNNPLEIQGAAGWQQDGKRLPKEDHKFLKACANQDEHGVAKAFAEWAHYWCTCDTDSRKVKVKARVWTKEFNERDERNDVASLAHSMGADWILSIDHDEIVEDRVGRKHFERLMAHPDPLVQSWDFGWVNHWDVPRLVRQDHPWADGSRYETGMRGFRFWRVNKEAPHKILAGTANGLHCGNCPDHDILAKRVSGIRFRHYGYMRGSDRSRKHQRYLKLDPNPDQALTGGGYGHLVGEEGMRLSPFMANDGIGLHMLVYEGESVDDVARWLDQVYGVVDRIVLVWTGEWLEEDHPKSFPCSPSLIDFAPSTGPGADMWRLAALFGAEFVHQPYDLNLASARNAGLDALQASQDGSGIGWALFFDPDEMLQDPFGAAVSLRRMAECTDSWGFLFRFDNWMRGKKSQSESIRMSRLDPEGLMRMNSRVHESFDNATQHLVSIGVHPNIRVAPFTTTNRGLGMTDSEMESKLRKYQKMLILELEDHPDNHGAWVSLGLQYSNDGEYEKAQECFQRAIVVSGSSYLPFQTMGLHLLRQAKDMFEQALHRTSRSHSYHRSASETVEILQKLAPPQDVLGLKRSNPDAQVEAPELPAFPIEELVNPELLAGLE